MPHGGWCPKGRAAEDGTIPLEYRLIETPGSDAAQRTEWNVRDSDATVIFSIQARLSGGSALTAQFAAQLARPCLHLCKQTDGERSATRLSAFVREYGPATLNIAGPRETEEPGIGSFVWETLEKCEAFREGAI